MNRDDLNKARDLIEQARGMIAVLKKEIDKACAGLDPDAEDFSEEDEALFMNQGNLEDAFVSCGSAIDSLDGIE